MTAREKRKDCAGENLPAAAQNRGSVFAASALARQPTTIAGTSRSPNVSPWGDVRRVSQR